MGYNTTVTGEIRIEPPLKWADFKESPFNRTSADAYDGTKNVELRVETETVETEDGPLMRKTAVAVIPAWGGHGKFYNLIEHVQQAIKAFPGHTFTGRLECEGEDNSDMWRVVIRDGRAVELKPRIVWPDDDEV